MRTEKDSIGEIQIPDEELYGIHTLRSVNNFPASDEKINPYLIKAFLQVKLAAVESNFQYEHINELKYRSICSAIENLLSEIEENIQNHSGSIYNKVIVNPYQGGAGTSLNMNVNEIIANTALKILGKNCGEYSIIHPIDDVNMSQSTNDVFPTALKIASIYLLRELADSYAVLQNALQKKEKEFRNVLKLGRTQFQDAVPITLGQEFGAYAQAISRDRWRLYNAEERLRSVNLGGTAVGNSISAAKDYVLGVNSILKKITKLPIAKSEDLIDATQNLDVFVEVHGIIKAGAVSLIKICNDLRFMSSGPQGGIGEIILPPKQAGSSIMPGKVNPVILENTIQICELVKGYDSVIANVVSSGNLELNAFIPLLAHLFLKSLMMLRDVVKNLSINCVEGIKADDERCKSNLINSTAIAATLIPVFGYDKIQEIVKYSIDNKIPFIDAVKNKNLCSVEKLLSIISKELGLEIE